MRDNMPIAPPSYMLSREAILKLRKSSEEGRPVLLVPTDRTAEFFEELRNVLGEEEEDDE